MFFAGRASCTILRAGSGKEKGVVRSKHRGRGENVRKLASAAQGSNDDRVDGRGQLKLPRTMVGVLCLAGGVAFAGTANLAQAQGLPPSQATTPAGSPPPAGAPATNSVPNAAAAAPGAAAAKETPAQKLADAKPEPAIAPLAANLNQYAGQAVTSIEYSGVDFAKSDRLIAELSQKQGEPLDPEKVRQTTRRLFATGRYRNIDVHVEKSSSGLTLIFAGIPRYYVGRIEIDGVRDDRLSSLLEYGTNLNPGTAFNDDDVNAATESVKTVLAQNGFYEPKIAVKTDRDDSGQQINVTYTVAVGPQARVGNVSITGKDPGITEAEFRKKGKLKRNSRVGRETVNNTLSDLRAYYQAKDRLEATVSLQQSTYDAATRTLNYHFNVEQGPVVQVKVEGAKISKSRLHLLVPVFEEGTVDNDLLNEGRSNMKDFLQQEGYFAPRVEVQQLHPGTGGETVLYTVEKGTKNKVAAVTITGNKYFSTELLKDSLKVQKANAYQRSGRFSTQLVASDSKTIEAIYRANGFSSVKVTSSVKETQTASNGKPLKVGEISVAFTVAEGPQQTFGTVKLNGVDPSRAAAIRGMLQATPGQPFSLATLSGDRDTVLSYYLSNGFDKARIEVTQNIEASDKLKTDIGYDVSEGEPVSIGKVLESGIRYTRPSTIADQVKVHNGDPLDQSALLETQRNLYNLALFNEVNAAVQNPAGDAEQKNVLVQITEAKRWDVTYGAGFEVQTGIPQRGLYTTAQGTTAAQQGKAGASPRVSIDVSRINLRGTDESLTFHGDYGLLEEVATASFNVPHIFNRKSLTGQIQGGYSNVQDITTFASSTLQGSIHISQKASRKDTFIYDFEYRRVAVNPDSLAISPNLIPLLSQPVRVGGPGITWFHDTRSPSPLDAGKGSYTSVQDFYASSIFGSQTTFNRTDASNATYYTFGKSKYVFARNTRIGFIESAGTNPNAGTVDSPAPQACAGVLLETNASCNPVPLPERLYAGGATSHRGFGINDAGPRDLQTGYPVGGSAVFVNSFELRLPVQTLPYVGNSLSFVLFHDMGNVFQHPSDLFPSFARVKQPNAGTCTPAFGNTIGTCNFNYFSHAIGVGARYHTAVGPIRVDFSYNLNPPVYPQFPTDGNPLSLPSQGQSGHFNFFFSIGQAF
jgi:outer membrane protein assembly complex protein YaeT